MRSSLILAATALTLTTNQDVSPCLTTLAPQKLNKPGIGAAGPVHAVDGIFRRAALDLHVGNLSIRSWPVRLANTREPRLVVPTRVHKDLRSINPNTPNGKIGFVLLSHSDLLFRDDCLVSRVEKYWVIFEEGLKIGPWTCFGKEFFELPDRIFKLT